MNIADALIDKKLTDSLWPEPVSILRIIPSGTKYEVVAEGVRSRQVHKRFLSEQVLEELANKLPHETDFGADPELYALGIEAMRIQLGYTFDPFFAVSTSLIDPLPHQLEAVYGTLLKKPRIRFLLADDPGAGKTVMAGLVLKELKYRGLAERVLIVTPANLTDQWRRELHDKFGEHFEVMNRGTRDASYGENPWKAKKQLITSVDFAKQEDNLEQLERADWDLVIVDEAHKLSARKYGDEVKRSQRYKLGEVLSRTSANLLFLTATPHQGEGDDEQFRLLLSLLEEDLFATTALLEEAAREGENPIMLRRLKENMTDFEGKPLFPPRYVHTPEFRLTPSERKLYEHVTDYVSKHFKQAWSEKKRNIGLAMAVLQRRLASSTYAIARSLERRHKRLSNLRDELDHLDDDPLWHLSDEELDDLPEEERWKFEDELAERLTLADNLPDLEREIRELKNLSEGAAVLARIEQDRKLTELFNILNALPQGEKLLIFTEHKDTLDYLVRVLRKRGEAVTSIDGSMRLEERIAAEREFRDQARIMVATEAAGEGINLQFCAVMVNYDLPWNPTRLEQRMGRIHRYGQRYDVHIYNLVAQGTREGDVLGRLLSKLEVMRQQLGSDRAYDVVGELLADVNLEKLITDHLLGRRSLADIQAMVDTRLSPERIGFIREVTLEALAERELDLSRLREQRRDSEPNRLQPEYIERFFKQAFARLGGSLETRSDGLLRLRMPYTLRQLGERIAAEYPRATFDGKKAPDAEFIAPGQPLFDAVLKRTLEDAEPALQQGATFSLPNGRGGLLAHLELAILDGTGQTVSRRLFALRDDEERDGAEIGRAQPRILIDATPSPPPETPPDTQVARERLRAWAHDHLLEPFLAEVSQARKREVGIRRKYGRKSLKHPMDASNKKLINFKLEARKGKEMSLPILQEERKLEGFKERLQALEDRLDREESLNSEPAELLALACINPAPAEGLTDADPALRRQVELAAMDYERQAGRDPRDVSAENLGYDIETGDRVIEVKGRAHGGDIVVTPNEWITAGRLEELYYLYIVTDALSEPKLHIIRDPANHLEALEAHGVVHYVIPQEAWKKAADSPAADEA